MSGGDPKAHARRTYTCSCGRTVSGNGGRSSHRRACAGYYLTSSQAFALRKAAWDAERAAEPPRPVSAVRAHIDAQRAR